MIKYKHVLRCLIFKTRIQNQVHLSLPFIFCILPVNFITEVLLINFVLALGYSCRPAKYTVSQFYPLMHGNKTEINDTHSNLISMTLG